MTDLIEETSKDDDDTDSTKGRSIDSTYSLVLVIGGGVSRALELWLVVRGHNGPKAPRAVVGRDGIIWSRVLFGAQPSQSYPPIAPLWWIRVDMGGSFRPKKLVPVPSGGPHDLALHITVGSLKHNTHFNMATKPLASKAANSDPGHHRQRFDARPHQCARAPIPCKAVDVTRP